MNYKVVVSETLQRIIEIDAESGVEAELKVRKQYRSEDIILDSTDFVAVEFKVFDFKNNELE